MAKKNETRLDSHLDKPSTVAPGDGPADTTDPNEIASSASPDKGAAAKAGWGTVNAVVKVGELGESTTRDSSNDRTEEYDATAPDGSTVRVKHNIETGETEVSGGGGRKSEPASA
jgi:hypothetical protein